jgi:hypothetical protein
MLRDCYGDKSSPKKIARAMIYDKLSVLLGYWSEEQWAEGLTDRERELVGGQLQKECDRIAKRLGYVEILHS